MLFRSPDAGFFKLAKEHGLAETAAKIAYERGIGTEEALEDFLKADLSHLHAPYLLHDMDKAVARIRQAIENYEQILVYGDYDADGMTSASIVKEALEMMGAEARVYLPNRFTDGYGPNESVYKYFIEQEGISLIVTVDNGVAGNEAIAYAQEQGDKGVKQRGINSQLGGLSTLAFTKHDMVWLAQDWTSENDFFNLTASYL